MQVALNSAAEIAWAQKQADVQEVIDFTIQELEGQNYSQYFEGPLYLPHTILQ